MDQQDCNTRIDNTVMDIVSVPFRHQEAAIGKTPELIGNRLRLHFDRLGQLSHGQLSLSDKGMYYS